MSELRPRVEGRGRALSGLRAGVHPDSWLREARGDHPVPERPRLNTVESVLLSKNLGAARRGPLRARLGGELAMSEVGF